MDRQSKIANKAIHQAARACDVEGNEWLHKLSEIQLTLNSRDNTARQHSPFFSLLGFKGKLGPSSLHYTITPYSPAEERHLNSSRNLYSSKVKQGKQANKKRNNYIPDLSTDSRLSLIHNTFHISKSKPYIENDWSNFPGRHCHGGSINYIADTPTIK